MSRRYYGNDLVLGTTPDGKEIKWTEIARRIHLYCCGKTGSGKSRFVQSLMQQDLDQHATSKQGFLLLANEGDLYDSVLAYIAEYPHLWNLPVVLIDLRKDDWVITYNLLKQREGIDPAVVATGFVEAFTHAFGGANPTDTPRLARIARMFIAALFDAKRTLFDILPLLLYGNNAMREALIEQLPESSTREFMEQFNQLSKRDFDTTVESFINRMSAFLSNRLIGHMVGQPSAPSFDFDIAIEQGAIVLVCLASENGKIAKSDGKMFASLMLSDLWLAATMRGKKGGGYTKPFAVYCDEFQDYLTYTMSQQLDMGRGFGLQFILANQFPEQIIDNGGEFGQAIYNSVMVNTGTKVVFQATEQQEYRAPLVAALFDGVVDVHRIETSITSIQTVGHTEEIRIVRGGSTSKGKTVTEGTATALGISEGVTVAEGSTKGRGNATIDGAARGHSRGYGHTSMLGGSDMQVTAISTPDQAGGMEAPIVVTTASDALGSSFVHGDSTMDSDSENESHAESQSEFEAESASRATQTVATQSTATNESKSKSKTKSASWQETIIQKPILEERPTQLMSVDNQLYEFGQKLSALPRQHAYVRVPGERSPVLIRALDCPEPGISESQVKRIRTRLITRMNCALMFAEAEARIKAARVLALPNLDDELRKSATSRRRTRVTVKETSDE